MLPWIGGLIVLATAYAIIKRYETRMVLFASGLLMSIIALSPMGAFDQFFKSMTKASLIGTILSVMGFAYVMKLTKADQHLVRLVAGAVKKFPFALIPAATIATFLINIALPSAAGVTAAVGAVLIPVLIASGVSPAVAAAAVFAGSFGSTLSPGSAHIAMVAKMAGVAEMDAIWAIAPAAAISGLIGAISLTIVAFIRKEHQGYVADDVEVIEDGFKVNLLKAFVPLLPLALLILANKPFELFDMPVYTAMLIGTMVAIVVTRTNPAKVTTAFFDGMGKAYGDIMGIIIAAGVFTYGLKAVGLIDALLNNLAGVEGAVGAAGTWGPMLVAILSGSGDAAAIAFNEAVTPHAAQFGMSITNLGTLASLAGSLGRTMSPVAGAAIVAAGIARVSPLEVAKRNMPGMIIASIVSFILMAL